jgi:hypothetical protein
VEREPPTERRDIRIIVDKFLVAEKSLVGTSSWRIDQNDAHRWRVNVAVGGELSGFALEVKAYPRSDLGKFRIILTADKAIWRLCCANDPPHVNPLTGPADTRGMIITGPHYHAWEDNRHYATARSLPDELRVARSLDGMSFASAFRWFCAGTGISGLASLDIPELPRRDRLL